MKRALLAGSLAVAAAVAACTGEPVSPSPSSVRAPLLELTERLQTEHFLFFYSPGDRVDVGRSEAYHRWATAYLGVSVPGRIEYYKFRQLTDVFCVDSQPSTECVPAGAIGMANTSLRRIYTSETWHPHECFHVYTRQIGMPPTFFNEGMATAHTVDPYSNDFVPRSNSAPGSLPLTTAAAYLYSTGQLVPVATLLTLSGWAQTPSGISYVEAGSFVRYLVDVYGLDRVKEVFRSIPYSDSPDTIQAKFQGIYGISLQAAELEWRAFLARVK